MRSKFNLSLREKREFDAIWNQTRHELINTEMVKHTKLES